MDLILQYVTVRSVDSVKNINYRIINVFDAGPPGNIYGVATLDVLYILPCPSSLRDREQFIGLVFSYV